MNIYQVYLSEQLIRTFDTLEAAQQMCPTATWKESNSHGKLWRYLEYTISEEEVQLSTRPGIGWNHSGHVYIDSDTANMMVFCRGKSRLLVLPEWHELMEPTRSCFQLSVHKAFGVPVSSRKKIPLKKE